MKKTRFTDEQMVTILREADEKPVPEVAKKNGVSAQTIYAWRKHFGSLEPSDVKRLRQLEQENGRLKKMVADRDLEIDVLKEITRKNGRRTRAPAAGCVRRRAGPVAPPRVRLAVRRAVHRRLRLPAHRPRRTGARPAPHVGRSVSAGRLSDDPHLPRAPRARTRDRPDVSLVAAGALAGPEEATAPTGGDQPPAAAAADGGESRLGV